MKVLSVLTVNKKLVKVLKEKASHMQWHPGKKNPLHWIEW